MTLIQKLLSLCLAAIFMIIALPYSVSAETDMRFGKQLLRKESNADLLLATYNKLEEGFSKAEPLITLSSIFSSEEKVSKDDLDFVFQMVVADYPEYFWLTGGYDYTYNSISDTVYSVEPLYAMTGSKLSSAKAALEAMTTPFLSDLEGKSEYEKSLILHDRLAKHITYTETDNDQTVYGAIVEAKAVCAGYAKAYHYLLSKAGIKAWSITGDSISPTTNQREGHRWSMAFIEGNWYYTDVTWDDQGPNIYHTYFNLSLDEMNTDHFPDDYRASLPEGGGDANYFKRNGLVFTEFDSKRIISLLKANGNNANMYIAGDKTVFQKAMKDGMEGVVKGLGAKGGSTYTYTESYLGNELSLRLIIEAPNHKHKLTLVSGHAPTCIATGTKDYYTCSCGRNFLDEAGQTPLTDKKVLITDRLAHTPSDWQHDELNHWRLCAVCSADIADSHGEHADSDKNSLCDLCNATFVAKAVKQKSSYGFIEFLGELPTIPVVTFSVFALFILGIIIYKNRKK